MKIRTRFVANSSTSSFTMHGVCIDYQQDCDEEDELDLYDEADKAGVSLHRPYDDSYFIGLEFSSMRKDQTRAQFEAETEEKVNKFLDQLKYTGQRNFNYYSEAWRD
jgi:hypothetical protein